MRKILALGTCLATTLVVVGCADQTTAPVAHTSSSVAVDAPSSLRSTASVLGASARTADLSSTAADRAINPADYVCSNVSPIGSWLDVKLDETFATKEEAARFLTLYNNAADLIVVYEAILFQTSSTPQYYGYDGDFTKAMVKVERDVKRFWDIPSSGIQVLAMHGDVLLDVERQARTYQSPLIYGLPRTVAVALATQNRNAILASTTMVDGKHPYWSFNAVAFSAPSLNIPNKIVMGDGILEGYAAIGYGDVAPQAIFAHEFAHQIQYANGYELGAPGDAPLPAKVTQAEFTRYNELMADAMSAYFLTHARGSALNQKRVEQFLSVFYQIGDCSFTSGGHHGTPNQRLAAARFGFEVADQAQKQGHILTSEQFHALFVAAYPSFVAPDAVAAK